MSSSTARHSRPGRPERQGEGQDTRPDAARHGRGGDGADCCAQTQGGDDHSSPTRCRAAANQLGGQRGDRNVGFPESGRWSGSAPWVDPSCAPKPTSAPSMSRSIATVEPTSVGSEGQDERDTSGEAGGGPAQVALLSQVGQELAGKSRDDDSGGEVLEPLTTRGPGRRSAAMVEPMASAATGRDRAQWTSTKLTTRMNANPSKAHGNRTISSHEPCRLVGDSSKQQTNSIRRRRFRWRSE